MKNKLTNECCIVLAMFIVFIPLSLAISTSEETTSVSRIVGNTPEDIINQLDVEELNLNHATYAAEDSAWNDDYEEKQEVIEALFEDYSTTVTTADFEANELLVVEEQEIPSLKNSFKQANPLFIYSKEYAGAAIPKQASFVNELTRYSLMIAPTFITSPEFVRAMLCNLGPEKTLGHSFREARNKYYQNTNPSAEEMLGLTLMSYHLYGNPLAVITTPKDTYSKDQLKAICGSLLGEDEESKRSFGTQSVSENIQETKTLSYTTESQESYQLLTAGDSLSLQQYELVKPLVTYQHELPLNAIITSIAYQFSNPQQYTLNLPEYDNGLAARNCYIQQENETVTTSVFYEEDKQLITLRAIPLRIDDCSSGAVTAFQEFTYTIDYISPSPFYFDSLQYPAQVIPNTDFKVNASLQYVNLESIDGEIDLYADNQLVFQQEVDANINGISIPLTSQNEEGFTKYRLAYADAAGNTLTEKYFTIETRVLKYWLDVPDVILSDQAQVTLNIINYKSSEVPIAVSDNLLDNNNERMTGADSTYTLSSGLNTFTYSYDHLEKAQQQYPLLFHLSYQDKSETLSDVLITNHPPAIEPIPAIAVRVGDLVEVTPVVTDKEGDDVTYTIDEPIGEDRTWQTQQGDAGNYTFIITASDGLASSTMAFQVEVKVNNPPELEQISDIRTKIGETITIFLSATDSDGDNLRYSIDERFTILDNSSFEWVTDAVGTFEITYTVSDGYDVVEKKLNIIVTEFVCSSDNDCPADSYSTNFCSENDVQKTFTDSSCINPGTVEAQCITSEQNIVEETCTYHCSNGQCVTDPCAGITCNDYCDGTTQMTSGTCSLGVCSYAPQIHAAECGYIPPACSSDNDCPADSYSTNFCSGNNVQKAFTDYSCQNPGMAEAQCIFTTTDQTQQICSSDQVCQNGICESTAREEISIDEFTTREYWIENIFYFRGSTSGGNYVGTITNAQDPYFYKNVTGFDESYDHLEIKYKGYPNGPRKLTLSYVDGTDCRGYSSTCRNAWNNSLINDGQWHIVDVEVTDAEWIDNDGTISQLKFDLDGATNLGTIYMDYIRFYKEGTQIHSACSSNNDCPSDSYSTNFCSGNNVQKVFTDYSCQNPGTTEAQCITNVQSVSVETCTYQCSSGQCVTDLCAGIACNDYCDGTTQMTSGTCSLGACSYTSQINAAECGYIEPACSSNNDCPSDSYSTNFCSGSNVVKAFTDYTCQDPGTAEAQCTSSEQNIVEETCTYQCSDGQCVADPCAEIDCNDYCDGTTQMTSGTCSLGACSYTSQINAAECGYIPPACSSDNDCPADSYSTNFCSGNNVVKAFTDYTCQDPGTAEAQCITNVQDITQETCTYQCSDGQCVTDLCAGIACNDYCDGTTQMTSGTCSLGVCSYAPQINAAECGYVPPACSSDNDCPADSYSTNFCSGNNVVKAFTDYSCQNSGTAEAQCIFTTTDQTQQICSSDQVCQNGICESTAREEISIDEFTTREYWTENPWYNRGSTSGGNYVGTITGALDPYFYKNVTGFDESYDHLEMKYKGYTYGPRHLVMSYVDGTDCLAYKSSCRNAWNNSLINDGQWHIIDVEVTDAEWIDNDGTISQLKFDLDGATNLGTIYIDYIRFYKE